MGATLKRAAGFYLSENINLVLFPASLVQLTHLCFTPDNLRMCTCMSVHSQASLWVSWVIVNNLYFSSLQEKCFHLNFPASHLV